MSKYDIENLQCVLRYGRKYGMFEEDESLEQLDEDDCYRIIEGLELLDQRELALKEKALFEKTRNR